MTKYKSQVSPNAKPVSERNSTAIDQESDKFVRKQKNFIERTRKVELNYK